MRKPHADTKEAIGSVIADNAGTSAARENDPLLGRRDPEQRARALIRQEIANHERRKEAREESKETKTSLLAGTFSGLFLLAMGASLAIAARKDGITDTGDKLFFAFSIVTAVVGFVTGSASIRAYCLFSSSDTPESRPTDAEPDLESRTAAILGAGNK